MSWRQVSLASVCDKPQYGAIAKGSDQPIGPRFVRQTDIASGRIDWSSVPFCDLPRDDCSKYAIKRGDVLISRLGNGVGNAATVRDTNDAVFAGYLVRFRARTSEADPEFIGYQLQSGAWRQHVAGFRSGAAQPTLNAQQMGEFQFLLPPIKEQRGIAGTLGALDDKIESNRQAIDLLEALARTCFANWREQTEVLKTDTFGSFAEVYGGATPRTNEPDYWDGGLTWTTPTDVTRLASPYLFSTSRTITEAGLDSCTALMHPVGSIFMTSRATIGAFAVNQIPASTNQGFIVVRPRRDAERWFLFEEMRSRVQDFLDNANGSTFLEISRGRFKELLLEIPSAGAIDELDSQLTPLHAKAAQLASESTRLERLRDTLLPELLSGRIHVPEARETVQEVVA